MVAYYDRPLTSGPALRVNINAYYSPIKIQMLFIFMTFNFKKNIHSYILIKTNTKSQLFLRSKVEIIKLINSFSIEYWVFWVGGDYEEETHCFFWKRRAETLRWRAPVILLLSLLLVSLSRQPAIYLVVVVVALPCIHQSPLYLVGWWSQGGGPPHTARQIYVELWWKCLH